MNKNLMYLLKANGAICGSSVTQLNMTNIQDLVINQDWQIFFILASLQRLSIGKGATFMQALYLFSLIKN